MIYKKTQSDEAPAAVKLEPLPTGAVNVWLTQNVQKEEIPPENDTATPTIAYTCDTVFFTLLGDDAAGVTAESISGEFENWWAYAEAWAADPTSATVEQRLSDLEDAFIESLGL